MKALQEQKLVLLCVRPAPPQGQAMPLPANVRDFTADEQYAKTTKVVPLHLGDAAEMVLLKSLQIDPQTATPLTVLMAPPAAVIGSYADEVTKDELVAKLDQAAQSGLLRPGMQLPSLISVTEGVRGRGPQRRHHEGRGHAVHRRPRSKRPLSAPARPSA